MEQFHKAIELTDAKDYLGAIGQLEEFTSQPKNTEHVPALILLRSIVLAHPPSLDSSSVSIPSESAILSKIKTLVMSQESVEKTSKAVVRLADRYREKSGTGMFLVGSVYDIFFEDRKKAEMFYALSASEWKNDMGACALGFSLVMFEVPDAEEQMFRRTRAIEYLKLASAAGNAMAKANLGVVCLSGIGTGSPDPECAQKLFEESAHLGNPIGLNNLIDLHLRRKTLTLEKCKEMLLNVGVLKMNNSRSMNMLGQIFESEGNFDDAVKYYKMAAEQDQARAIYNLGRVTIEGKGTVEKDFNEGYRLLCLSASLGDALAKSAVQKIRSEAKKKKGV